MKLVKLTTRNRSEYQARVAALEAIAHYPLGQDSFRIDHGPDYFAFFDRLGEPHYYAWVDGERVVAVASGIVRRLPRKAWYLCDLKVHPDYRGRHLPLRMLARAFFPNYFRCPRGYAITMDPSDGRPNRIAKLVSHWKLTPMSLAPGLRLYSLGAAEMRDLAPLLARHRGELSYLSLRGVKDLILGSTGAPLPLLHVQFGPCAAPGLPAPREGFTHMFCAPENDPLAAELDARGLRPSATATVLQHGMRRQDWRFILTSDI